MYASKYYTSDNICEIDQVILVKYKSKLSGSTYKLDSAWVLIENKHVNLKQKLRSYEKAITNILQKIF
jgi:hypothetical protein